MCLRPDHGDVLVRVKTHGEGDLLGERMTVHDSGVTGTNDIFVVQDGQLSFESGHSMYGFLRASQYESGADIFVIDTAYTDPDVIAAERLLDLVFHLVVKSGDFDFVLVGHEKEGVALAHESGLDLADRSESTRLNSSHSGEARMPSSA